jgi:predicted Rossmann fold flavoprotein
MQIVDVIIIGAGAAGLMCGIEAGKRQRRTLILESSNKPGKKILMSGGGRCNFTNQFISPEKFISHNSHFCKSALSRYTQWDFIELVKRKKIAFHEKTLGQLFCDEKSKDILNLLLDECVTNHVDLKLNVKINKVEKVKDHHFIVTTSSGKFQSHSLVVATGGLSIPTLGASPFGYQLAEQFNLSVLPTRAGLVPLTLHNQEKALFSSLSGVSIPVIVSTAKMQFKENMLFTHRGLSGPAILQISSYWQPGETLNFNFYPEGNITEFLSQAKQTDRDKQLSTVLQIIFPKRFIEILLPAILDIKMKSLSAANLQTCEQLFHFYKIKPNGTEGYRTAEVTLGGVDCDALSSQTMAVKNVPGLFFIGEVVDVTGWLGGYNFQWAWSSGWAAGQVV